MKRDLERVIEIPEGVQVEISGDFAKTIVAKGPEGEVVRSFHLPKISLNQEEREGKKVIVLSMKKATKGHKRYMHTISAHIANMVKGASEGFTYELKVCASHFPMTVEFSGTEGTVKNFLGEKIPRKVRVPEGVKVEVKKDIIAITSPDKELAGQAAANFEKSTVVKSRDRRVFQDGIFMIKKAGREL